MGPFGSIPVVYGIRVSPRDYKLPSPLSGPDPDHLLEIVDEDLPVADLPVPAAVRIRSTTAGDELVVHCASILTLGMKSTTYSAPRYTSVCPFCVRPLHLEERHPGHAHLVERLLHSSSLNGLMIASIFSSGLSFFRITFRPMGAGLTSCIPPPRAPRGPVPSALPPPRPQAHRLVEPEEDQVTTKE